MTRCLAEIGTYHLPDDERMRFVLSHGRGLTIYLFQYALYVPGLTVVLKAPLVIPPLSWHLDKIRGGYERGSKAKVDSSNVTLTKATLPTPEVA